MKFNKIFIEITKSCNLRCSFCRTEGSPLRFMKLDLFQSIIPQCAPLTDEITLHVMGEPLLHPQLEEILDSAHSHKVPVFLVSNGTLMDERRQELLRHPAIRQVSFSLHAFIDNFGMDGFSDYIFTLWRWTLDTFSKRPDLYINYRLWNLDNPTDASSSESALAHIEALLQSTIPRDTDTRFRKSRNLTHRLYLHFDTRFEWPRLDHPIIHEQGHCYALDSHFGILCDGTVIPCCLDRDACIPLGKINATTSLRSILESEHVNKIKDGFNKQILVEELCRRCSYISRFDKKLDQ